MRFPIVDLGRESDEVLELALRLRSDGEQKPSVNERFGVYLGGVGEGGSRCDGPAGRGTAEIGLDDGGIK